MPVKEEVRLDFRVDGRDELKSAAAATREATTAVDVYAVAERKLALARGAGIEVILREQSEQKALNGYLSASADVAVASEAKFRRYGRAAKDVGDKTADMGRAAMNAGQSFQDFVQGGFGGILNNLPKLSEDAAKYVPKLDKLAAVFGGPAGLAAAATFAGVAIYALGPALQSLWSHLTKGGESFPKAAGGLKAMETEIKANAKSLEDLEANWRGTSAELEKANKLIERNAELERKSDEERKRRAKVEDLVKKEEAGARDEEGGEIARAAIEGAGGAKKVIAEVAAQNTKNSAVVDGAQKELGRATAEKAAADRDFKRANPSDWKHYGEAKARKAKADKAVADAQARLAAGRKAAEDRAADLVTAATDGDGAAIEELAGRLPHTDLAQATAGVRKNQDELDAADMAETERTPEQRRKLAERKARAARKKAAEARRARLAGYEADDAREAESTPEELRQSEIMEALDARRSKGGGARLNEKQSIDASASAMRYEDAGAGREDALDAALDGVAAPAERLRAQAEREGRRGSAGRRLRDQREQAYETAAGIATSENQGEFGPAQLESIAREAADSSGGMDVGSIRQAVYRAAAMTRQKIQQDLDRNMGRMWQGGESFLE